MRSKFILLPIIFFLLIPLIGVFTAQAQRKIIPLDRLPHFHGLAIDSSNPSRLILATHKGLYFVNSKGETELLDSPKGDLMSFIVHPNKPKTFFVSGVSPQGEGLGVLLSSDNGKVWKQILKGAQPKLGFNMMDINRANPNVLYGYTSKLHISEDGGGSWRDAANTPPGLITIGASSLKVETIYGATRSGLMISKDGGANWKSAYHVKKPATMVHTTSKGRIYAFILGVGLITAMESDLKWKKLSNRFDDQVLLRMAVDPSNPEKLYAISSPSTVVTSSDGGKTWTGFEGSHNAKPEIIAKGKKIYVTYCQSCHGVNGIGEKQKKPDPKQPEKIIAPALDNSDHAYHHSDKNLVNTILNGVSRKGGSPMIGWKNTLSQKDAENIVAYIKSLWSFRSFACQGGRHMACMRHSK